ncbi:hypothetical protein BD779DRAFT_1490171 [Infundibulicybe gibba]|nr:hypothetical protein BD779DRAFT_1490171 [Infundibulicybe gibba]
MYQPQPQQHESSYNPYSAYSAQYPPASVPLTLPYFSPYPNTAPRASPPPDLLPSPPDLTSVSPDVASTSIQRLVSAELRSAGFDSAHTAAVQRIELEVITFIEHLFERAHEYANLANRAEAIASDLLLACDDSNLPIEVLRTVKTKGGKRKKRVIESNTDIGVPTLIPPPSRSPSPELLSSDDEDVMPIIPITLRGLSSHLPALPPKHTYLRTPVSPPKKAALPSLEKKLKTAGLVQESLKNLLLATEENTNQEDGELLGHIVNWEMSVHPRKRWKFSA